MTIGRSLSFLRKGVIPAEAGIQKSWIPDQVPYDKGKGVPRPNLFGREKNDLFGLQVVGGRMGNLPGLSEAEGFAHAVSL